MSLIRIVDLPRMNYRLVLILFVGSLLSGALGAWGFHAYFAPATAPSSISESNDHDRPGLASAAQSALPTVVSVKALGALTRGTSKGSGVLIDGSGLIATNQHVIEGSERIRVTLFDRRELWAEVIGTDPATDLALLKVEAGETLPHIEFGNSDSLYIGEWLLAVGNPFGLRSTVTAGILSARGRSIDALKDEARIESFLQTDAAVNPGSSGGALVDGNGNLVGINTAILSRSGRHEGFNFAIPGNLARSVLLDLQDFGEVRRATLGVYVQTVNDAQARTAGLPRARGVILTKLVRDGAALRAGLEIDDILLSINGKRVRSAQQMQEILSQYEPGEKVRIAFRRSKREREVSVTLGGNHPELRPKLVTEDAIYRDFSPEVAH